jgi:hypothetical protein
VRRFLVWLVALPLVLAGAQLAHAVDYWLIAPDAHERSELLAGSGHAYFSYLPFFVALAGGLLVAGFVAVAVEARGARAVRPLDCWPLAVLPLATFVLQEHLERYVHDGAFPWHAVTERTFAVGLVLQIPFAIAAYVLTRLLLRAAESLGRLSVPRPRFRRVAVHVLAPATVDAPIIAPLASGHPARGPPALTPA